MTRNRLGPVAIMALVVFVGCLVAVGTYQVAAPATATDSPVPAKILAKAKTVRTTPTASAFARAFVSALNAYAAHRHDSRRLTNAHCVEATPGRYMCSYALVKPNGTSECHLMQARWSPRHPITVIRAGRTARCETLHAALRSLR